MKDEASYNCESCGEETVVPIDLTAGSRQEYVEDLPRSLPRNRKRDWD
jgi:Cysteine-rich CPXCG